MFLLKEPCQFLCGNRLHNIFQLKQFDTNTYNTNSSTQTGQLKHYIHLLGWSQPCIWHADFQHLLTTLSATSRKFARVTVSLLTEPSPEVLSPSSLNICALTIASVIVHPTWFLAGYDSNVQGAEHFASLNMRAAMCKRTCNWFASQRQPECSAEIPSSMEQCAVFACQQCVMGINTKTTGACTNSTQTHTYTNAHSNTCTPAASGCPPSHDLAWWSWDEAGTAGTTWFPTRWSQHHVSIPSVVAAPNKYAYTYTHKYVHTWVTAGESPVHWQQCSTVIFEISQALAMTSHKSKVAEQGAFITYLYVCNWQVSNCGFIYTPVRMQLVGTHQRH